ncbi:MAG: hypothetical protein MZV63_28585 [Marinilabiliales bacterium]|nr:hypothetical protein [Marinilabiliales bacterium]
MRLEGLFIIVSFSLILRFDLTTLNRIEMKWTIISILCMFVVISASGQQNLTEDFTEAPSPVNIGDG